jgi:hypothetical protein
MRIKHSLLVIVAATMIAPAFLHSQRGGGPGGGMGGPGGGMGGPGGKTDPNQLFMMMSKGKDVLTRSEMSERGQAMFDNLAPVVGAKNGVMTREQFVGGMEKMTGALRMSSNARPDGGSSGPMMFTQGGGPMGGGNERRDSRQDGGGREFRFGGNPTGGPPMGGPSMGGGGPQGGGQNQQQDRWFEDRFQRYDLNKDGMLGFEELPERMKADRDKFDSNSDGFISFDEYKKYATEQMAQFNNNNQRPERKEGSSPNQDNNDPRQNGPTFNIVTPPTEEKEEEVRRPTLYRVGKLPKELPSWFEELDKDIDGQVGLYEWRKDGRDLYEFETMDFNADGLLTPEEVLKFFKVGEDDKKKIATNGSRSAYGTTGNGRPNGGNGGGQGGGDFMSRFSSDSGGSSDKRGRGNDGPPRDSSEKKSFGPGGGMFNKGGEGREKGFGPGGGMFNKGGGEREKKDFGGFGGGPFGGGKDRERKKN